MFKANVVGILVASPSDTLHERKAVAEAIEAWSSFNAEATGVAFLPLLWERDSVPEMGDRAQGVLNRQLGDRADAVIGIFWTRVGTPTGESESGSIEEIERAYAAGRPVMVYFSSAPVMQENLDTDQWEKLQAFRARVEEEGLIHRFGDTEELVRKVSMALTSLSRQNFGGEVLAPEPAPLRGHAQLIARIEREPRVSTVGGRVQQSNHYRLVIENTGSAAAERVSFSMVVEGDVDENTLPRIIDADQAVSRLMPRNPISYHLIVAMGMVSQFDIDLTWQEGSETFTERQTLRW